MFLVKHKKKKSKKRVLPLYLIKDNIKFTKQKQNQYVIPVTPNFSLSLKRVAFSWKNFHGIIKVPMSLTTKLPAVTGGESTSAIYILVTLVPINQDSKPMVLRYLFKSKKVNLLTSRDFEFLDKPSATNLDLVASSLKIGPAFKIVPEQSEEFFPIARRLIYQLRRDLRRHRVKRLGLKNMNVNARVSKDAFGKAIQLVLFTLNKCKKVTRCKRKRQNRLRDKMKLEYKVFAQKNRLRKKNEEQEKEKRREQKLNKRFHTAVSLAYLKQLKLLERIYTNESPEKHLDRLFSSVSLKEKISSLKKEFFDSDN
jgi:hypothetical protein